MAFFNNEVLGMGRAVVNLLNPVGQSLKSSHHKMDWSLPGWRAIFCLRGI